jgi:hypothetical protein
MSEFAEPRLPSGDGPNNRSSIEYTGGERRIAVPVYLCEDCTEELEDDIFYELDIAVSITNLHDEGFQILISGLCTKEVLSEMGFLINDKVSWCHAGHEGGFGDDLVFGPEDTEHWDRVWERTKHVYEEIFDEMARWREVDPDK